MVTFDFQAWWLKLKGYELESCGGRRKPDTLVFQLAFSAGGTEVNQTPKLSTLSSFVLV